MTPNPLKTIYENKQKIKELEAEIKKIESENQNCLEYALLKGITERGEYKIRTVITPRREPIPEKVWALCGEEARQFATFRIKDIENILSANQIDSVCKVNESVKRVVEMVD